MAIVIYSETDGVYLGSFLGLGFWSKLDAVGQMTAPAFASEAVAEDYMASWDCGRPADVRLVEVTPDQNGDVTMAACVSAGLPGWLVEDTPVENVLPI